MLDNHAQRGPGDIYPTLVTTGRIVAAAALGAGAGQSATVVAAGVAVIEDTANTRAATGSDLLSLGSENSHFANWKYPSSAANRRAGVPKVLLADARVGGDTARAAAAGILSVLGGDTVANLAVDVAVTISIANDLTRGSFIPATTGTTIFGYVLVAPLATGAVNPQPMTIKFDSEGYGTFP